MSSTVDTIKAIAVKTTHNQSSMEAEQYDDEGRLIYHIVLIKELERTGVSPTACGRLFVRTAHCTISTGRRRGQTLCPMCLLAFEMEHGISFMEFKYGHHQPA